MALSEDEKLQVDLQIKQANRDNPTSLGDVVASVVTAQNTANSALAAAGAAQSKADAALPVSTYNTNRTTDQNATSAAQTAASNAQTTANAALPTATYNTNRTADNAASVSDSRLSSNVWLKTGLLTGFASGAGVVAASDTILSAIQKINGNDILKAPIDNPTFTGTATIPALSITNGATIGGVLTSGAFTGDKFIFYSGLNYGLAVQPSQLQIKTNAVSDNIDLGYGPTGGMTVNVRSMGNGNVLIGTLTDGGQKLQVNGTGAFSGVLTAPTASAGTNTTQVATTAFIQTAIGGARVGTSVTATASPGVGAGTSPTAISVTSATTNGGILSFTTGSSPVSGTIITVTFGTTYASAPKVMLERYSDPAVLGTTLYKVGTITTTTFTLINVGSSTLSASSIYTMAYEVFI